MKKLLKNLSIGIFGITLVTLIVLRVVGVDPKIKGRTLASG